jgi:hypothetical protein
MQGAAPGADDPPTRSALASAFVRRRSSALCFRAPVLAAALCFRTLVPVAALGISTLIAGCGASLLRDTGTGDAAAGRSHAGAVAASHADGPAAFRRDATVTVLPRVAGKPIAPGFVGVSFEFPALTAYAGDDPQHLDPALVRLIENLAPGQPPVIRIGGDSTDTTWWPVAGMARPGGITFTLSPRWLATLRALTLEVHARLILGVDMEAGHPELSRAEADAFVAALGKPSLQALELGNEPGRYPMFAWYHNSAGAPVYARSSGYNLKAFTIEFGRVAALMPGGLALAGPTLAGDDWMAGLAPFIAHAPRLGLITFHRYPLNRCFTGPRSPGYPTVAHLLTRAASEGLAQPVGRYVAVARQAKLPLRIDELGSVACGGKRGVSDTFASALWALDSLFALARAGVVGVNIHSFPGAAYGLFNFSRRNRRWATTVHPEYYGLLMFAKAAPPGSRLISVRTAGERNLRAWATRGPDGAIRVVLMNEDLTRGMAVLMRSLPHGAKASILRMTAPSAYATSGVRLGGAAFGVYSGGRLGPLRFSVAPSPAPGEYLVRLPPASAALLTVHRR